MAAQMATTVPKLRLVVGGTLIEGAQVTLEDLPRAEQGGAAELIQFLGGVKRVFILQKPVVYGAEEAKPRYLVVRQDQIQACEFVAPEVAEVETADQIRNFRWEWDE